MLDPSRRDNGAELKISDPYSSGKWKPRLVLVEMLEQMRHKRSINTALSTITTLLGCKSNEMRKFTHKFNGHKWQGYIYLKRNSLMGTIFSYWDTKALIIRGYPKIKYTHDARILDQECAVEEKIDGTNIGLWTLPNNKLMGKTRMVERWDQGGYHGRFWNKLFDQTGLVKSITKLCKDDYEVFGELYGKENKGEFIAYTIPVGFKVFEILDRRSFGFVPYEKKIKLAQHYGLPVVSLVWKGVLTFKEVSRIEFELKAQMKENGMEGCVAKYYNTNDLDVYMAKLKCAEVKEACWKLSAFTLPRYVIGKAIQKARENLTQFSTKQEFEDFVKDELLEDATPELVSRSKDKIKRMIYEKLTPKTIEHIDEINNFIKSLVDKGIDINHKGKIMSSLANKFIGYNPSDLFLAYQNYIVDSKKNESKSEKTKS